MAIAFDFQQRTVLVTGAAQGIGFELGRLFAESGANVVALDRNEDTLRSAWPDTTGRTLVRALDVADSAAVDATVTAALEAFGSIDVIVNNAGITRDSVVWKMSDEAWSEVLAVHLGGTFNLTRAAIPHMRAEGHGRIINVTSYSGMHGNVGQANYAAAKAGIIGFTKTVAKEVARFGITVNAISPNAETPMVAAIPANKKAELTAQVPMGRFGSPTEMATAVAFLASDEAAYITGVVLAIDGGISI